MVAFVSTTSTGPATSPTAAGAGGLPEGRQLPGELGLDGYALYKGWVQFTWACRASDPLPRAVASLWVMADPGHKGEKYSNTCEPPVHVGGPEAAFEDFKPVGGEAQSRDMMDPG